MHCAEQPSFTHVAPSSQSASVSHSARTGTPTHMPSQHVAHSPQSASVEQSVGLGAQWAEQSSLTQIWPSPQSESTAHMGGAIGSAMQMPSVQAQQAGQSSSLVHLGSTGTHQEAHASTTHW